MKKILAMLLCVLMLVSVMAACSNGGDDDVNNKNQNNGPVGNVTDEIEGTQSTAKAGDKPEGWTEADATQSIHFTTTAQINSLERWSFSGNQTTYFIYDLISDPILAKDEEGNVIPWLCDSYEMAEDNMSITMHFRDDVWFTNGNKFTAEDAAFTLETIRDSERYPDSYAKPWRNYIDTVDRIDEDTIKINFSQLMPEFWSQITNMNIAILDKDVFLEQGPDTYWLNPAGTGAYTIRTWDPANTKIVLDIRTDEHGYFGYKLQNSWTNVKTITIEYSPESQTRLASLRTGETDIIDIVPTTDVEALVSEGFTVEKELPSTERFIQYACGEGDAFYDKNLREAFSLCLDRELLAETIMNGFAIAISWPAQEGQYGYQENPTNTYKYDPDRARELVEASDYNGEKLTMIASATIVPEASELAVAIQSMAAEVGINIEVRTCENAIFDELRASREFDLCLANIGGGTNHWYKTVSEVIGQDRFNSGTTTKSLIEPAAEVATTIDPEKLEELYSTVYEELLTSYDGLTLLYWPIDCSVYSSRITNIKHYSTNEPYVRQVVVVDSEGNPL